LHRDQDSTDLERQGFHRERVNTPEDTISFTESYDFDVVRRRYGHSQSTLRSGRLELNLVAREARIDDALLRLGRKEYLLLEFLILKRGSALARPPV
jgi:hypothetical protein